MRKVVRDTKLGQNIILKLKQKNGILQKYKVAQNVKDLNNKENERN